MKTQGGTGQRLGAVVRIGDEQHNATISLYGGQVVSWVDAGHEQLFLSERTFATAGKPIRGGIPIIFPQFADAGSGPRHGFARTVTWTLMSISRRPQTSEIILCLTDSDASRQVWPHRFLLVQTIRLRAESLQIELQATNTDEDAWAFSAALHSYWRIAPGSELRLGSLEGCSFEDRSAIGDGHAPCDPLRIGPEIERYYNNAPPNLEFHLGRRLYFASESWPDLMIWNPGTIKARALTDLEPGGEAAFICIEPLRLIPITLAPGDTWRGLHSIYPTHDSMTYHI